MFETSHISSDDVCLDTDNEMNQSPSSRKAMVLDLLKYGLLNDSNGGLSVRTKAKILEALGLGNWENSVDLVELHTKRAQRENYGEEKLEILSVDDHSIHIDEHTKWVLENVGDKRKDEILKHIQLHKTAISNLNSIN